MGASQQQRASNYQSLEPVERVLGGSLVLARLLRGSLGGVCGCGKNRLVFIPAIRSPARVRASERNVCCRVGRPLTELLVQAIRNLDERDNPNNGHVRSAVPSCRIC